MSRPQFTILKTPTTINFYRLNAWFNAQTQRDHQIQANIVILTRINHNKCQTLDSTRDAVKAFYGRVIDAS